MVSTTLSCKLGSAQLHVETACTHSWHALTHKPHPGGGGGGGGGLIINKRIYWVRYFVLHEGGGISPATPRNQSNDQPSSGQVQEAVQT